MQILEGLPRAEFKQSLICSVERDESFMAEVRRLRARGVRVEVVPMKREPAPLSDLGALFRILRHLKAQRYDIVHTHSSKAGALGRTAAVLARVPHVVHTPHVFPFSQVNLPYYRKVLYRLIEKLMGAVSDRIIAVSAWQRALALKSGIGRPDRVTLIHNGVPLPSEAGPAGRRRIRKELGVERSEILVGTAGRIMAQKGHKLLVEAAAMLLDLHPQLRFFIAGSGELEHPLRATINQLSWCRQRISLLGDRTDMPDLLAAADVFVLPSLWEGMPYALIEAMAAGKPVICANVGGMEEAVTDGENGLLVRAGDSVALASAIARLVEDPGLRKRLGEAAQRTVSEHFRAEDKLQQLARLYKALASQKKSRRASRAKV
jgi:glycosyltransferase involved in cell wall biosynthesis